MTVVIGVDLVDARTEETRVRTVLFMDEQVRISALLYRHETVASRNCIAFDS